MRLGSIKIRVLIDNGQDKSKKKQLINLSVHADKCHFGMKK